MPLQWTLSDRCLRLVATGDVEHDEGLSALAAGLEAARTAPEPCHALLDIRASSGDREAGELREIARVMAENRDVLTGRTAVVTADAVHYGVARMFGAYAEMHHVEVSVFTEIEAAEAWLDGRPS